MSVNFKPHFQYRESLSEALSFGGDPKSLKLLPEMFL